VSGQVEISVNGYKKKEQKGLQKTIDMPYVMSPKLALFFVDMYFRQESMLVFCIMLYLYAGCDNCYGFHLDYL